jgi:large subunit ribosomal protein L10
MGIEPMDIGLDIEAAFEDGLIYKSDVLGINTEQLVADMTNAASDCFKLSIGIGFPTAQNITFLVQKSWNGAKALAKEINYLCKATAGDVLAKAEAGMGELKKLVKVEEKAEGSGQEAEEKSAEGKKPESQTPNPKPQTPVEEAPVAEAPAEEKPAEPANE